MCLDNVSLPTPIGTGTGVGYKVFRQSAHNPETLYPLYWSSHKQLPTGRWLNSAHYREDWYPCQICAYDGQDYPSGWHFFESLNDAKSYSTGCVGVTPSRTTVRTVYWRRLVAEGEQAGRRVLVAKEIFILDCRSQ